MVWQTAWQLAFALANQETDEISHALIIFLFSNHISNVFRVVRSCAKLFFFFFFSSTSEYLYY